MAARKKKKVPAPEVAAPAPIDVPDTIPAPREPIVPALSPAIVPALPDPPMAPQGITCPTCACRHLPVYRTTQRNGVIIRERYCRHCGRRILTYERQQGAVSPLLIT